MISVYKKALEINPRLSFYFLLFFGFTFSQASLTVSLLIFGKLS